MLIPMKELNRMSPNYDGKRTSIYFLENGIVLVRFKHLNDSQKRDLFKKYEYVKDTNIRGLITPYDILETEKGFCGYVEKCVPNIDKKHVYEFQDYVNEYRYSVSLDMITDYFLSCSDIIEEAHKEDIVNPDLCTGQNCYYDFHKKEATFVDFHDMQVKDIESKGYSDFIAIDKVIYSKKYHKGELWTPNIDYYILAIRYFYYATKINLPRVAAMGMDINEIINMANIKGTKFADVLKILYDQNKDNENIKDAIIELNKNYKLSKFVPNTPRTFIKK